MYDIIRKKTVQVVNGKSGIVGERRVEFQVENTKLLLHAVHAPEFISNIHTTHILSRRFEVLLPSTREQEKTCLFFIKNLNLNDSNLILKVKCNHDLYILKDQTSICLNTKVNFNLSTSTYETWNKKLRNIFAHRYMMLSDTVLDVPTLSSQFIWGHVYVSCLTAKMKRASVRPLSKLLMSTASIHVDISGAVHSLSLGENHFTIPLLEKYSHILDVFTMKNKSDLSSQVKWFISKANNWYASESKPATHLRIDNASENLATDLADFCADTRIDTKTSPAYAPESYELTEGSVQEIWLRARVLLFASDWGENMWRRSTLSRKLVKNKIDVLCDRL